MAKNQITRTTHFQVEQYPEGYAVCAVTYEQVKHVRSGAIDAQVVGCRKLMPMRYDKRVAERDLHTLQHSEPFENFRKRQ